MNLPIIKYRNVWFAISSALVVASVAVLFLFPLKFGIDFRGGSLLELSFSGERPTPAQVGEVVSGLGYGESVTQTVGDDSVLIRTSELKEDDHQKVLGALRENYGDIEELRFESVGPTVGAELRSKAIWSVSLVLIAIALYVAYAFRKVAGSVASWKFGVITLIVGVVHDVLLPVAAFALLGHFTLAEVNSSFIAAILTVLGFSVHDTIVVFDRIRENLSKTAGSFEQVAERSVNETMARSINTSLTTLLPIVAIYLWGGATLKHFAFTLIVGLLAGTYSSICLASPLLVVMQKKGAK